MVYYPPHVNTKIHSDDPQWAHEILSLLYQSVFERTEAHISNQTKPSDPALGQIDLFGSHVGTPEVTANVIRRIARRLYQPIPQVLRDPESDLLSRLIDSAPDVVQAAVQEAKLEFQRPGGVTHVYIRVKRHSISIERITPHRIQLDR